MSNSHVTGWASDAPTPAQIKELFAQIESGRVTKESLQAFLRGETIESFPISVDYGQTLASMIASCKLDWVNSGITQKNFPFTGNGKIELLPELVHFGKGISSDNALKEIDLRGLRPATLPELLAFGTKYPEKQREFPVVALGSVWTSSGGNRYVPDLYENDSKRRLSLGWCGGDWDDNCRFLSVRK